ncbi:hypothetical protein RJ639_031424 [Escallonia herrerae]|uniref:Uncharacterized protein n=1 Tax=Escallonia herrerae TaxID=1293975 RepID=A0AA88X1U5_9ASTE|nr:hypothetical protein RJ639_031424 [Escallonia herrerae]
MEVGELGNQAKTNGGTPLAAGWRNMADDGYEGDAVEEGVGKAANEVGGAGKTADEVRRQGCRQCGGGPGW